MATHKGNAYIDLSGWSPRYFPEPLVRQANSLLQDKVLFGSDFPLLTPQRWRRDLDALGLKEQVVPKILKDNAVRVLGLDGHLARYKIPRHVTPPRPLGARR